MSGRRVEDCLAGLRELWGLTRGDPRVCIAVLDGPADLTHSCFDGALLRQVNLLGPTDRTRGAALRHGTHVASLIFGQHHSAVRGVAAKCRGVIIPIYREADDGSLVPCSQLDLARAISLAVTVGAAVVNISAGVFDMTGQPEPPLARALRMCQEQDILIVASAGNQGCDCPYVPAAVPSVLAVGAMTAAGEPLASSSWAAAYRSHGVLAPGEAIAGATPGGAVELGSGTSVAAGIVSGVVGLLLSLQLRRRGTIDTAAVTKAILDSAHGCDVPAAGDCARLLAGRLNVSGATAIVCEGEPKTMSNPSLPDARGSSESARVSRSAAAIDLADGGCSLSIADRYVEPDTVRTGPSRTQMTVGSAGPGPERGSRTIERYVHHSPPERESDAAGSLVYVLGQIWYDFGSQARRDAFAQRLKSQEVTPNQLLALLRKKPYEATGLTWTVMQENTPIYALQPTGPFAEKTFAALRNLLRGQLEKDEDKQITQVSIPGRLGGRVILMDGHEVSVIHPEVRGMCGWSPAKLIEAVLQSSAANPAAIGPQRQQILDFLERVYYELSNLGMSPPERAINYAATNLYQVAEVYKTALEKDLKLDAIAVERSPICRPGSDCWDVKLTLFDPKLRREGPREVYRLTVDVSEVIPVTVGKVRHWSVYSRE